jgi:hypothetical protein
VYNIVISINRSPDIQEVHLKAELLLITDAKMFKICLLVLCIQLANVSSGHVFNVPVMNLRFRVSKIEA